MQTTFLLLDFSNPSNNINELDYFIGKPTPPPFFTSYETELCLRKFSTKTPGLLTYVES